MIDEYPILSVAAAFADGKTVMRGWRNCGSRKATGCPPSRAGWKPMASPSPKRADGLTVKGRARSPGGGTVTTHMDHRIAMSFLTMGMAAQKPVTVDDITMIATSFPGYQDLMRDLGADFSGTAP